MRKRVLWLHPLVTLDDHFKVHMANEMLQEIDKKFQELLDSVEEQMVVYIKDKLNEVEDVKEREVLRNIVVTQLEIDASHFE